VRPVHDAVSGKIIVRRTLPAVPAVGLVLLPIAVFLSKGLVRKIPDKPSLVEGLAQGQIRVAVHPAAGISHRVRILAANKGLVPVLLQKGFDRLRGRVHLALHIAGRGPGPVVENALVVDQAVPIELPEPVRHIPDDRPAVRLVSHGPDQNGGMVFIPLVTGVHAVQQKLPPAQVVGGYCPGRGLPELDRRPAGVRLHIVFRDHIQAEFVTEPVQGGGIRIMAGPHRVDVVLFHQDQVLPRDFVRYDPPAVTEKLMSVHPPEDDAFSVDAHQPVLHFEPAETDALADDLQKDRLLPGSPVCRAVSLLTDQPQRQGIELRILRAPEPRFFHFLPDLQVRLLKAASSPSLLTAGMPGGLSRRARSGLPGSLSRRARSGLPGRFFCPPKSKRGKRRRPVRSLFFLPERDPSGADTGVLPRQFIIQGKPAGPAFRPGYPVYPGCSCIRHSGILHACAPGLPAGPGSVLVRTGFQKVRMDPHLCVDLQRA